MIIEPYGLVDPLFSMRTSGKINRMMLNFLVRAFSTLKVTPLTLALLVGAQVHTHGQVTHEVTLLFSQAQKLVADAGPDILNPVAVLQLGAMPSVTGGTPPYSVTWTPESFLSDAHSLNPILNISEDIDITYSLSVTDSKGCSSDDEMHVRLVVTGDDTVQGGVSVFPNPSASILHIESTLRMKNVRLINYSGVVVYSVAAPGQKVEISLHSLSQGTYLLQFEIEGVQVIRRVNVVR
jgi:hypothetical protein